MVNAHLVQYVIRVAEEKAFKMHGPLTTDVVRASAILTEEVGEVVSEALAMTRHPPVNGSRLRMIRELAQVAATAIQMLDQHIKEADVEDNT